VNLVKIQNDARSTWYLPQFIQLDRKVVAQSLNKGSHRPEYDVERDSENETPSNQIDQFNLGPLKVPSGWH